MENGVVTMCRPSLSCLLTTQLNHLASWSGMYWCCYELQVENCSNLAGWYFVFLVECGCFLTQGNGTTVLYIYFFLSKTTLLQAINTVSSSLLPSCTQYYPSHDIPLAIQHTATQHIMASQEFMSGLGHQVSQLLHVIITAILHIY